MVLLTNILYFVFKVINLQIVMPTAFFYHNDCLDHKTGENHPEIPRRLAVILELLKLNEFKSLVVAEAQIADLSLINLVHSKEYISKFYDQLPFNDLMNLDADTVVSAGTAVAARRAVGAVCDAVDYVMDSSYRNAFCAVRPPGHHARYNTAMGFCIFNNIAIGARYAQVFKHVKRVAVVDFDVHHGNGTEELFCGNDNLFYASSHQFPAYPGTGAETNTVRNNLINVGLRPYSGSEAFREAYEEKILPGLLNFNPELIMLSAGFDGHKDDPLCQLNLVVEDFNWVTKELIKVSRQCCQGRLVSVLEGGYHLGALKDCVASHLFGLSG